MNKKGDIRQGDITLRPIDRLPKARRTERRVRGEGIVVASGEATGHHHRIRHPKARSYRLGGERYVYVPRGVHDAEMTHGDAEGRGDHTALAVPPGSYQVVNQREYIPPAPKAPTIQRQRWVMD